MTIPRNPTETARQLDLRDSQIVSAVIEVFNSELETQLIEVNPGESMDYSPHRAPQTETGERVTAHVFTKVIANEVANQLRNAGWQFKNVEPWPDAMTPFTVTELTRPKRTGSLKLSFEPISPLTSEG